MTKNQNPVLINKYTDWDYFNYLLECNINLSALLKTADQLEKELNNLGLPSKKLHGVVPLL
jgi:hypothetical protein